MSVKTENDIRINPPLNTPIRIATSQTIQGLALLAGNPTWLPLEGPGGRQCLPAHTFNDVPPAAWNDNAVRWLAEFDIASGFPGGGFGPLEVFNRAQASQWFDRFFPDVHGAEVGTTRQHDRRRHPPTLFGA